MGSVIVEGEINGQPIQSIQTGLKGTNDRGLDTHSEVQGVGWTTSRVLSNYAKRGDTGNLRVTVISGRVSCSGCISRFATYQTTLHSTAGPNMNVQVQFYSFGLFGSARWVP